MNDYDENDHDQIKSNDAGDSCAHAESSEYGDPVGNEHYRVNHC